MIRNRLLALPEAAPLALLLAIALILALTTPAFRATDNLLGVVADVAVVGVVALALGQLIQGGEIDVSVGSSLAACAIAFARAAEHGGIALGLATAVGMGALVGAVNGLLVGVLAVPSIIATLGVLLALRGGVLLFGADGVQLVTDGARGFGAGDAAPIAVLLAAFVAITIISRQTIWGRDTLAIGGNPRAARTIGLPVRRTTFANFVLVGVATGLAAAIFAGRLGQIQATAATGFELRAIAAVVLGGTTIAGGRGSTVAPLAGAMLVGVILNALTLTGVPSTYEQLALGCLILFAVGLDALRARSA